MNVVYSFRLTRILFEQIAKQGAAIPAVLENWDEADYAQLRDYVSSCRSVVPKYVQKLADLVGKSPREVVAQINDAQAPTLGTSGADQGQEPVFLTYLPEDRADTCFYLSGFCKDRERPV